MKHAVNLNPAQCLMWRIQTVLRAQVSRDVLQRWSFPFCPDTNLLRLPPPSPFADSSTFTYSRCNIYRC